MKRSLLLLFTLFLLSSCSSSTSPPEPTSDFRYTTYHPVATGPIVIWEGQDGSRFQLTTGGTMHMHCGDPNAGGYVPSWETLKWVYLWPDGAIRDSWEGYPNLFMGAECELVGSLGVSLTFSGVDSLNNPFSETTPSANEVLVGGCLQFTKQLPGGDVVQYWADFNGMPELFDEIDFPDPMPEVTYRAEEPCSG